MLLLFDGHALIHRAYHAFANTRTLTLSKTGEVVGAVYGFAQMVLKVSNEIQPTHWALAFDLPTPTFRHRSYEQYKAHRPTTPEELRSQIQRVRQLVETFSIPIYEAEGFEADDVIGTLSRQAQAQGVETIIITGDADTMQLVSPGIRVLYPKPGKSFSDTELFDEALVRDRYGVSPAQFPDLKGLKGDASDNIPGVPGIGEKRALALLQQFGNLEGIYQRLEEVKTPSLQDTLRRNQDLAFLSKKLATIVTDVSVSLDMGRCALTTFDRSRVVALFQELGFASLIPRLPSLPQEAQSAATTTATYEVVDTPQALTALASRLAHAQQLAVDVETTGKEALTTALVGISLAMERGRAYYIPVGHWGGDPQLPLDLVKEKLAPFLKNPSLPKIAHNGKYDMAVLSRYDLDIETLSFDTMVAAHLLGEKSLGLKALAFSRLGVEMTPITDLIGTGHKQLSMAQVPVARVAPYASADADMTLRLKEIFDGEVKKEGLASLFFDVEMPLTPILLEMERNGVALDSALLGQLAITLGMELGRLEGEIYQAIGHRFNINSTQQLAAVLYEELKLPHSRRTKTGYSTDASALEELKGNHPAISLILDYRQLMKLKSTYVDTLPQLVSPQTGRLHTTFSQTGTATGRLSSAEPNLQNIPIRGEWGKKIRQAIIAPEGSLLLAGDYSQIDLRALAHLSQDPNLVSAFLRDEDIHTATASQVFSVALVEVTPDMRRLAKTINFGVIYGMSEYGLEQATELSREEAAQFITAYFEKYQGVKAYLEGIKGKARERGYVETLLGRRRYLPEINSANRQVREAAERMAINMPVQGTSADIIKLAMLRLHEEMKRRKLKAKLLLQVHDELVFEVPQEEMAEMRELVLQLMPQALKLSVPLKVEIKGGKNWAEME